MLSKKIALILPVILFFIMPVSQAMHCVPEISERRMSNILDVTIFTTVASVVNDCVNADRLLFYQLLDHGISSWLSGEMCETIYKKVYKKLTGKDLRSGLGTTDFTGVEGYFEIDHQRLLRRIITCVLVYCFVYLCPAGPVESVLEYLFVF